MNGIDHLVYRVADLSQGMEQIEELLGVRPVLGGRHPAFGTHNALVSLGPSTYLEVVAADPDLAAPARGRLFGTGTGEGACLVTWVVRAEGLEPAADALRAAGFDPGSIGTGGRERPDGTTLTWRLTDPYAMLLGGALPFLIAWGDSPHPTAVAPRAGKLVGLGIEHPQADGVQRALGALGAFEIPVDVRSGERCRLTASIETPAGVCDLG